MIGNVFLNPISIGLFPSPFPILGLAYSFIPIPFRFPLVIPISLLPFPYC